MKLQNQFRDAGPGWPTVWTQAIATQVMRTSRVVRRKVRNAGEVADFLDWQETSFLVAVPPYRRRESLWRALHTRIDRNRPVLVLEFGVAWGYATATWMEMFDSRYNVQWHGFDRFTGLPRAWREHGQGAFNADGEPPGISDTRVTWHVGDIEDKLPLLDLAAYEEHQILAVFDLDIFEPSLFAWDCINEHLDTGDLLYFDEAMDDDERRLLNEHILPSHHRFSPVGATPTALGLQVL